MILKMFLSNLYDVIKGWYFTVQPQPEESQMWVFNSQHTTLFNFSAENRGHLISWPRLYNLKGQQFTKALSLSARQTCVFLNYNNSL